MQPSINALIQSWRLSSDTAQKYMTSSLLPICDIHYVMYMMQYLTSSPESNMVFGKSYQVLSPLFRCLQPDMYCWA